MELALSCLQMRMDYTQSGVKGEPLMILSRVWERPQPLMFRSRLDHFFFFFRVLASHAAIFECRNSTEVRAYLFMLNVVQRVFFSCSLLIPYEAMVYNI